MSEGFSAEPCFYDLESFCSYSFLHLCEMGFGECLVPIPAGLSEASFSSEALDKVFDVWYLFELPDHEGVEVPFGIVLYWSS